MIYTCTTNPSLDYYISLNDDFVSGQEYRSSAELYEAGGKGVNVSIILSNLNIPSRALGFLGGFTKEFYLSFLKKYKYLQALFTTIKDNTRINIKLMSDLHESSINALGPDISDEEFLRFINRLDTIFTNDIFVLSGSIQPDIQDRIADMIYGLSENGVKVIIDSTRDFEERTLAAHPYLVSVNSETNITSDEMAKEMISDFIAKGAERVMLSNKNGISYLGSGEHLYKCVVKETELFNMTGHDDAMVAGFIFCILRGGNDLECFKYANGASLSSSMSCDEDLRSKVEEWADNIEVIEIL